MGPSEYLPVVIIIAAFVLIVLFLRSRSRGTPAPTQPSAKPNDALARESFLAAAKQVVQGATFEDVTVSSADEAITALFERAMPATPSISVEALNSHYDKLKAPWCSQKLHRGTRAQIQSLMEKNLRRIQSDPAFQRFTVKVDLLHCGAQVFASVRPYAIPVCVWRSGDTHFACGNSDFHE